MIAQSADRTVLALPDERRPVAALRAIMAIQAVVGDIDLPAHEPFGPGDPLRLVENFFIRLEEF